LLSAVDDVTQQTPDTLKFAFYTPEYMKIALERSNGKMTQEKIVEDLLSFNPKVTDCFDDSNNLEQIEL